MGYCAACDAVCDMTPFRHILDMDITECGGSAPPGWKFIREESSSAVLYCGRCLEDDAFINECALAKARKIPP